MPPIHTLAESDGNPLNRLVHANAKEWRGKIARAESDLRRVQIMALSSDGDRLLHNPKLSRENSDEILRQAKERADKKIATRKAELKGN